MNHKVELVAEIAQTHDGSLGILHSYIDALADTGVDTIKFQTHIAEAESSVHEPFRVPFSYVDKTRFDYWKRMEFTTDQWRGIKTHCEDRGLQFLSSPFSNAAVDLLESIGTERYKIGSGEISNLLMLEKIAKTGKPIILSSGMSSLDELDATVNFLKPFGNPLTILQCTTSYPTQPQEWGLNVMTEYRQRYELPIGFSDHSGDIYAPLAATALGARMLEFHVVFDKRMFGPDARSSLTIEQICILAQGVRSIEIALNSPVNKQDSSRFTELKSMFGKSLCVNRNIHKGETITPQMLESKKPSGRGISVHEYREIIGKKAARELNRWDFLRHQDVEESS